MTAMVSFTLAVIAGASLLASSLSSDLIAVSTGVGTVRLFKGESATIPLAVGSNSKRWVTLTSISLPENHWSDGRVSDLGEGKVEAVITPTMAGRFEGFSAIVNEVDPLGLFQYHRTVRVDVEFESLPRALRRSGKLPKTAFASVGENPSGSAGTGQEMFGVSDYQSGLDTRDIMWKRAAKLSPESMRLPMRLREGSTKKLVKVGLAVGSYRDQEERDATVDRIAEALGQLGSDLFLIGATIEVFYGVEGRLASEAASNLAELGNLVVGPWTGSDGSVDPRELSRNVDLLILEPRDSEQVRVLASASTAPLLVVSAASRPMRLPPRAAVFSGVEDLTELAGLVLTAS